MEIDNIITLVIVISIAIEFMENKNKVNIKEKLSETLNLEINPIGGRILLRDTRIFIYGLTTSLASMAAILEVFRIGDTVGQISTLKIKVLMISILFLLANYLFSGLSSKIVGIEKRKIRWLDIIKIAILSLFLLYFYNKKLYDSWRMSLMSMYIIFSCFLVALNEFFFAYILIWWNYFCGKTIIYEEELIEIIPIDLEKYEIILKERNKRFILNKETSLKLKNCSIENLAVVDIKAKTSLFSNVMLITDMWQK